MCTANSLHIFQVEINQITGIQNPHFAMLPAVHLKDEVDLWQVPLTLSNLLDEVIQVAKHMMIWSFQVYADYQKLQDLEIHQFVVEKSDARLPCTLLNTKSLFYPAEVNRHRMINLDHTLQSPENQQALIEEYKDI